MDYLAFLAFLSQLIFIPGFYILFLPFLFVIFVKTLYLIALYQVKEYRFDRVMAHFKETQEGKRILREFLFSKKAIVLWILLILLPFFGNNNISWLFLALLLIILVIEVKDLLIKLKKRQVFRPVFTAKVWMLYILMGIIAFIFFLSPAIIFFDRLLFFLVPLLVFLLSIPTFFAKKILMEMARRKRMQMKGLIVIGVTGSYGKSSTKELIGDFLSVKYNVLKTPGSVNTDIGVAQFILRNLKKEHEVFVVEVGAYKRGEIATVCNMVQPKIGVLTGINEQHLSLFGSLENTKKAKFELIESLPEDGMAFFNGDDKIVVDLEKRRKRKLETYIYNTDALSIKHLGGVMKLAPRVKSNPFLVNVAGAVLVATKLGVKPLKLQQAIAKAIKTLGIKRQEKDDLVVLDDSFNTNPKGFVAALDILSNEKGKKILVTPGIIELGSESARIHKELGEKIAKVCDTIILTIDNFEEPIREGLLVAKFPMENFLTSKREDLVSAVKDKLKDKTVVLLEGRVPAEVIRYLSLRGA